jgi:hypothetical protein
MTQAEKRDHVLAAAAMENHRQLDQIMPRAVRALAVRAYELCKGDRHLISPESVYAVDLEAAARLRACAEKGEPLP